MMLTKAVKITAAVLLWLVCFHGIVFGEDASPENMPIGNVKIVGNNNVTSMKVMAAVVCKAGNKFDSKIAAEDCKRIAQLEGVEYGYFNTTVADGKVDLTYVVVEKNIIRSITFVGNKKYKQKALLKKIDFKKADYLDPVLVQGSVTKLSDYYKKQGFPFVEVTLGEKSIETGNIVYNIKEGPRAKITAIKFEGNVGYKSKELKKVLKFKKKKFLIFNNYFNQEEIDKDVARLQNAYYDRGYLDVAIVMEPYFNEKKNRVQLVYKLKEGNSYSVEKLIISGNQLFSVDQIRTGMKLEESKTYNKRKATADEKMMLKMHKEAGFINAAVEQKLYFISSNKVNVEYIITQGERFRIGQINITGNEQAQDKVVRRVLDEYDFRPGDWYNADIAAGDGNGKLEKMIKRMTYSQSATVTPSGQAAGQRDAQVSVIEGQTGSIMLGAGVGSDSGVVGQIVYEQRNFDIKDKPEDFEDFITGKAYKGAGQTFRISAMPGTEYSTYSVSFTEPYLNNKPISMDVVGSFYTREQECYLEERTKGLVSFEKRYKDDWRRSIGFGLENVNVSDLDTDSPKEIYDVEGNNLLASVIFGIGLDKTDDRMNPTTGYNFHTSYEQFGGDYTFGILSATFKRFHTLYEDLAERKTILSNKLLAATTVGDAPAFEKFYAGGTGTYGMRGFEYRGVSTRGLQTHLAPGKKPERKDPVGSDWIFLANSEVSVPLVGDTLSWLFFVDSGTIDTGPYRASVGMGIQILIPQWFGPVPMKFELAAPLLKDSDDDTQIFSFSVGRLF